MLFANTNVVHAQPVEQDFDGISFVKVSSGDFIFGTPPTSNYWTATEKQSPMALGQSFLEVFWNTFGVSWSPFGLL